MTRGRGGSGAEVSVNQLYNTFDPLLYPQPRKNRQAITSIFRHEVLMILGGRGLNAFRQSRVCEGEILVCIK